jgi:hypothetical protein
MNLEASEAAVELISLSIVISKVTKNKK